MKKFNEFVNEGIEEANEDTKFLQFLEEVKDAFTKDFKRDTPEEAIAFVDQYHNVLQDSFNNGFTVREAIAATKIPGTMVTVAKVDESFAFQIDDDFENTYKELESIESEKDFEHAEEIINGFYQKYYRKSFSDARITERLKNNYKSLIRMYEEKVNEIL